MHKVIEIGTCSGFRACYDPGHITKCSSRASPHTFFRREWWAGACWLRDPAAPGSVMSLPSAAGCGCLRKGACVCVCVSVCV